MHKITTKTVIFIEGTNQHKVVFDSLVALPQVGEAIFIENIKGRVEERRFHYTSENELVVSIHIKQFPEMVF